MKRINSRREDEMMQRHMLEKKRLPKILKNEMKTRQMMFKQSLRISGITTVEQEREKIKQVISVGNRFWYFTKSYDYRYYCSYDITVLLLLLLL